MNFLSKIAIPTIIVATLVFGVWLLLSIKKWVIESEYEVRSMHVSGMILAKYVSIHKSWPNDWSDLEAVEKAEVLKTQYNVDLDEMRKFVTIDFRYDMCNPREDETFTAFRPTKNYYVYSKEDAIFEALIAALDEVCSARQ